ncbi:hypothetical protein Tco_0301120 [Tanacetum coccineum]
MKWKTLLFPNSIFKSSRIQVLTIKFLFSVSHKIKLEKAQAEAALYEAQPSFPNVERLTELLGIKHYVEELEIEIPGDLKEIPKKLEEFQYFVSALTKQVAELKNLNLEVQVRLLALPGQKEIEQSVKADVAKAEIKKGKEELIDLLGLEVVERMYKDKMKCDRYYNKMLNRRAQGKITNCYVLSRGKGPITLKMMVLMKLYRTLRPMICTWGNGGKSTKRYKTLAQLVDHQVGTVLNEPSLGMILFNSHQKQDFVSIEDFDDLNNEMLYNVQEIFFRLHKGYGTNDPARTFSTFLVAEVEKRNLNPSKQMRLIEQLKQ